MRENRFWLSIPAARLGCNASTGPSPGLLAERRGAIAVHPVRHAPCGRDQWADRGPEAGDRASSRRLLDRLLCRGALTFRRRHQALADGAGDRFDRPLHLHRRRLRQRPGPAAGVGHGLSRRHRRRAASGAGARGAAEHQGLAGSAAREVAGQGTLRGCLRRERHARRARCCSIFTIPSTRRCCDPSWQPC